MAEREMPAGMKRVMKSPVWKLFQKANTWIYRRTDGKFGGRLAGAPVVLLTTKGRKSGLPRTVPLLYLRDGGDLVVVASKGGWADHPLWYQNLCTDPQVQVQVGRDKRPMVARTASDDERARLWPQLVSLYAAYADYQSWTDRKIPLVILSPPLN